jgi:hypothetical protein
MYVHRVRGEHSSTNLINIVFFEILTFFENKGNYEEKLSQEIMRRNYHRKL